ncbi:MAG: cupredoxin domain-containing protein [Acidobacteriota bacterium]
MKSLKLLLLVGLAFGQTPPEPKPDRIVSILAERFTYNPSRITVKQGQLVEFVLESDDTDHGFKIPTAGIDVAIPPVGKGAVRVRFVAREKGTYEFECSRACGAGHHLMRGAIVVK